MTDQRVGGFVASTGGMQLQLGGLPMKVLVTTNEGVEQCGFGGLVREVRFRR